MVTAGLTAAMGLTAFILLMTDYYLYREMRFIGYAIPTLWLTICYLIIFFFDLPIVTLRSALRLGIFIMFFSLALFSVIQHLQRAREK